MFVDDLDIMLRCILGFWSSFVFEKNRRIGVSMLTLSSIDLYQFCEHVQVFATLKKLFVQPEKTSLCIKNESLFLSNRRIKMALMHREIHYTVTCKYSQIASEYVSQRILGSKKRSPYS